MTFSRCEAYRVADELHLTALWAWLDASRQRCGSTFVVERSPWIEELVDVHPLRHYVVCTLDDVIEVACEADPEWDELGDALGEPPLPARSQHLWVGEDDAQVERLGEVIQRRQERYQDGRSAADADGPQR